jgi:hypothetical protein
MKSLQRFGVVAATAVAAFGLVAAPASARSGVIYSGGGADCAGMWNGGGVFYLMDRAGGNDDDYCYIDYGSSRKLAEKRRVSIDIDSHINEWQSAYADTSGLDDTIYFKVCEERENDNDLCSNVGAYGL